MTTNIGLSEADRNTIASLLHTHLANQVLLGIKLRNYHWNVTGKNFSQDHSFFESLYSAGNERVDEIAERIRMLGVSTSASMQEYLTLTTLKEETQTGLSAETMLQNTLSDYEAIIRQLRTDIDSIGDLGDQGSEDFLTALMQDFEKSAWMIRATLS